MKIKTLLPFLALAALILIIGLACGGTVTPTANPPPPPSQPAQPTQPQVQPTVPQVQPTVPPPTQGAPDFFTENFTSTEIPNWSYFLTSGDKNHMTITSGGHKLSFDLEGEDIWVYLMYDPYIYTDVRIDGQADNRGKNNNNVSFICRYNKKEGWYEFNIANNGLYQIYYGKWDSGGKTASYDTIADGGSTAIKQGKDVNDYTVACVGETLALYINGTEVKTVTDRNYRLREGQIGIGVSSFNVYPIIVEWKYVTISQP